MYQTINKTDFRLAFRDMGRIEQFTYDGLDALFDWLEEYEESTGERVELDVIALCCDFSQTLLKDLEDETGCKTLEELGDKTLVVYNDDETVLYQAF